MIDHRRELEATNAGHCFADCSCGWRGGVYPSRRDAAYAHVAHVEGSRPPQPVKPVFMFLNPPEEKGEIR
mgnify:CR=1 FL=1